MLKNPLPGLTSLRFFAAIWVVLFHLRSNWSLPRPLQSILDAGYSGVTLFFVLSGFILSYNYIPRRFTLRDFLSARVARILPIYFFALLISLPLGMRACYQAGTTFFPRATPALFLMQAWAPKSTLIWNPPGWSLSCEVFFYLVFPFLLGPIARAAQRRPTTLLAATWLLGLIPSTLYALMLPEGNVGIFSSAVGLNVIKFNPVLRLPEFLMGMVLGALYLKGKRITRPRAAIAGSVIALGIVFTMPWRLPYPAFHDGLLAPFFGILIFALACTPKMLTLPILELLGESSYSLYLLHAPLINYCTSVAKRLQWPPHGIIGLCWGAIAVLASIESYKRIEVPARAFVRFRLMRGEYRVVETR